MSQFDINKVISACKKIQDADLADVVGGADYNFHIFDYNFTEDTICQSILNEFPKLGTMVPLFAQFANKSVKEACESQGYPLSIIQAVIDQYTAGHTAEEFK